MITTRQTKNQIKMDIKLNLSHETIFKFLHQKGYRIENWFWEFEDETFPGGITKYGSWTFVALKNDEIPSEDNIYTTVLEREVFLLLNQIEGAA